MNRTDTDFDSLQIGDQECSHGRTLAETDLSFSCMLTGSWHPIHADQEHARGTEIGQRILHGCYGLMLACGMASDMPFLGSAVITDLGIRDWRYLLPLFVGDTVHVEMEITGKRITSNPARGVLERRLRLVKASGALAHEGISTLLIARKAETR